MVALLIALFYVVPVEFSFIIVWENEIVWEFVVKSESLFKFSLVGTIIYVPCR